MPKFKVYVRQWTEEIGEGIIETSDEDEARQLAHEGEIDFEWSDGNDTHDFEVMKVEPIDDPDNELGGDEDDYQELVEEPKEDPEA